MIVGGIWFFLREKRSSPSAPPPPGSPVPPTPTPAPIATPRNYSWLWWIIAVLAAIIAYHFIAPALRTTAPAPQATAPKQSFEQSEPIALDLIEDRSIGVSVQQRDFRGKAQEMTIQSGSRALFFADIFQLPQNGRVCLRAYITRYFPGEMVIIVNGVKFTIVHRGGGKQWNALDFPASAFVIGTNSIILSSPGEELIILSPNLKTKG